MSLGQILIGCGVDMALNAYCYFSVLHRKHSKAVSLAVFMLFAVISVAKHILLYDHMLVRTFMQWVFIQLLFWVLFTDSLWKRFGLMVAYVGGVAVTEALTLSLLNSLGLNVVNTDESFLYSYTIAMILSALYTFFLVHLLKRRNDSFESHASRFVLMYVFIQLLLCLLLYVLIWDYGMDIVPVMLLFAFTVAVSTAFGVLLYHSMKASFAQRLKAETAEVRVSLYEEQLKRLRLQHEEYKKLRANYYRHIRTLHALGDANKRSAYIDELTKELVSDTETVFSEDEALDALLFGERLRAEQLGLRADFKACPFPIPISVRCSRRCSMKRCGGRCLRTVRRSALSARRSLPRTGSWSSMCAAAAARSRMRCLRSLKRSRQNTTARRWIPATRAFTVIRSAPSCDGDKMKINKTAA